MIGVLLDEEALTMTSFIESIWGPDRYFITECVLQNRWRQVTVAFWSFLSQAFTSDIMSLAGAAYDGQ